MMPKNMRIGPVITPSFGYQNLLRAIVAQAALPSLGKAARFSVLSHLPIQSVRPREH